MNVLKITAEARAEFGNSAAAKYRREGKVPCVMYGGDEVCHFMVDAKEIKSFVHTPLFNVIEVELDGKVTRTILKDIHFHPVMETIEHIDFQELVPGRKVKVSVPVRLEGDAEGVKEGGSLVTVIRKLQLKITPESLIDEIKGDITHLNLRESIYVRDMDIPEGVEVLQDMGSPVGYIEVPRSLKSLESSADLLEEGEEGEEGATEEGAPAAEGEETAAE